MTSPGACKQMTMLRVHGNRGDWNPQWVPPGLMCRLCQRQHFLCQRYGQSTHNPAHTRLSRPSTKCEPFQWRNDTGWKNDHMQPEVKELLQLHSRHEGFRAIFHFLAQTRLKEAKQKQFSAAMQFRRWNKKQKTRWTCPPQEGPSPA